LEDGSTEVEVPSLRFPGQTVAGYDWTVEIPELSGFIITTARIEIDSAQSAAINCLVLMQAPRVELRGGGAQQEVRELLRLIMQLIE